MQDELIETNEILIGEYEELERRYVHQRDNLTRVRQEVRELRLQLKLALEEIEELQNLLARSYVK